MVKKGEKLGLHLFEGIELLPAGLVESGEAIVDCFASDKVDAGFLF